jgi:hypothetical protein
MRNTAIITASKNIHAARVNASAEKAIMKSAAKVQAIVKDILFEEDTVEKLYIIYYSS